MPMRSEPHHSDRQRRRPAWRLVLTAAGQARGWIAVLALALIAEAIGATLLPAVLGRAVDVALGRATGGPEWVAGCAGLILLVVGCGAAGQVAGGLSDAGVTAWLRRRLRRHLLAVGPGL